MQFRGYSLPVHDCSGTIGPSPCPVSEALIRPRDLFRLLAVGMCHFILVYYLGIVFLGRVEDQNITDILNKKENLLYSGLCCPRGPQMENQRKWKEREVVGLCKKIKKAVEHEEDGDIYVIEALGTVLNALEKGLKELEIRRLIVIIWSTALLWSVRILRRG